MKTVSRVILGCKLSSTEQVVKKMLLLKVIGMFWRYRQVVDGQKKATHKETWWWNDGVSNSSSHYHLACWFHSEWVAWLPCLFWVSFSIQFCLQGLPLLASSCCNHGLSYFSMSSLVYFDHRVHQLTLYSCGKVYRWL